jgi:hypothetical protein
LENNPKNISQKLTSKTTPHPQHGAPKAWQKQQQTKTTKHTIEFSNNTPGFQATSPFYSVVGVESTPTFRGYRKVFQTARRSACGAPA